MPRRSTSLLLLPVALLAACPPGGQDPGTSSGSSSTGGSTGLSMSSEPSSSTAEPTPTTSTDTSTSGDTGTTGDATTDVDPGTTQPVDTTAVETTTGETTTGETTTGETTGVDTTGTTADDSTSTNDTSEIPDTTGGELCGRGADGVDLEWQLEVPPELAGFAIKTQCQIVEAVEAEPEVTVTMTCELNGGLEQVVLHYKLLPFRQFEWSKTVDVKLEYHTEPGPFTREWLHISAPPTGFWGVHADALVPPGTTVEDYYFQEMKIDAPCDPQPDPCGQRQGLEVNFEYWVEGMPFWLPVRSGEEMSFGFPGLVYVWLEHASRLLEPIGCPDVAPRWFDMMIISDVFGG